MKTPFLIAALLAVTTAAYAAYDPAVSAAVPPDAKIFSLEFVSNLGGLMFWGALLGRAYQALRNGGGLVGIWRGVLFGSNVPKTIATDYKEELKQETAQASGVAKLLCLGLLFLGAGGIVATTMTGCSTVSSWASTSDEVKVQKVTSTVSGLTAASVSIAVANNPETKVYFQAAAEALNVAIGDGTVAPEQIRTLLTKAFGAEHQTSVNTTFGVVLGLYQTFYGLNVSNALDAKPAFRAVLAGLSQGITSGLGGSVSSAAYDLSLEDLKLSR